MLRPLTVLSAALAIIAATIVGTPFLVSSVSAQTSADNEMIFFRVGTGGVNGTYYPVGALIGNAISSPPGSRPCDKGGSCGVPGLVAIAQSSHGSVDNVRRIQQGHLVSGFAQADVVHAAATGTGVFDGNQPMDKLRALANLFPEALHLVVRKGAGISTAIDLKGRRVSLDEPGSGTLIAAKIVLAAHGLREADVVAEYLKPGPAASKMRRGELDAFFIVAGAPAKAVTSLIHAGVAQLTQISGAPADKIIGEHRFFWKTMIAKDTYDDLGSIETIAVGAQWVVSADVPDDLVYAICKALWREETQALLANGHPKARFITLDTALSGISIQLHPGAERCYRELGKLQ